MPSSLLSIVPQLSRSFKYQQYAQYSDDEPSTSCCPRVDNGREEHPKDSHDPDRVHQTTHLCFEVRPSTNGIGMFATRPIAIGDIIIDSEEPIVSTSMSLFPFRKITKSTLGSPTNGKDRGEVALAKKRNSTTSNQDDDNKAEQNGQSIHGRRMVDPPFCQTCGTPIGNLRQDHIKAPLHLELPGIEKGDIGLVFTVDADEQNGDGTDSGEDAVGDQVCRTYWSPHSRSSVAWCSKDCLGKGRDIHAWLAFSDDARSDYGMQLQKFLEERDNPKIFELAIQAILLVLVTREGHNAGITSAHYQDHKSSDSVSSDCASYNYWWWEDYGSHPLWWKIGADENRRDRFLRTQEFAGILRDWCNERTSWMRKMSASKKGIEQRSSKRRRTDPKGTDGPPSTKGISQDVPDSGGDIDSLCSVNSVGALLGMLQCNVMEFSYPSPLQQYMEQAEELLEDGHFASLERATDHEDMHSRHEDDENGGTSQDDDIGHSGLVRGCEWLKKNYGNAAKDDEPSKERTYVSPEPVVGSGLYPLLTLANHHCNPNASIEFLRESNRGSMVALRPIKTGEEICITYVPNGDNTKQQSQGRDEDGNTGADEECSGDYFKHFEPTRTWKWLNHQVENDETGDEDFETSSQTTKSPDEDSFGQEDDVNTTEVSGDHHSPVHECVADQELDEQSASSELVSGDNPKQRAQALLEYGFVCKCSRCEYENK